MDTYIPTYIYAYMHTYMQLCVHMGRNVLDTGNLLQQQSFPMYIITVCNVYHNCLLHTALCHCSSCGQVSVLAIHVVGPTARVITQPDAKVLDCRWLLLINLWHITDPK